MPQYNDKYLSRNTETQKVKFTRRHKMSIINKIISFIQSIREANYAANLARNGKIKEAQSYYR